MKIVLIFILLSISLSAQNPPFNGLGDGTELNPYQIWTKNDLMELRDSVNGDYSYVVSHYALANWTYGKHFRLMVDIDNVTQSIGRGTFYGYFHGAGKKITVAIIPSPPYAGTPLFLKVTGNIDSLTLDGIINEGTAGIANYLMPQYGVPTDVSISHCINNATITEWGSGGIAYSNSGTISHCINNGDITGVDCVAGIAGDNQSGTIINCINTGKITATNSGSAPYNNESGVGGIAAFNKNNISNCINLGTVEGQNHVGGIVGWASQLVHSASQITNCINYGYIKGTNAVGGILGYMRPIVNISNCVNAGVVEGESDVGSITGKEN